MTRQSDEERRRYKRVPLALAGHCRLEDGADHACRTENVSATGILVRGVPGGGVGEWVVAYLGELGRVEGLIVRCAKEGFAFELAATPAMVQRLGARLQLLSQRELREADPCF